MKCGGIPVGLFLLTVIESPLPDASARAASSQLVETQRQSYQLFRSGRTSEAMQAFRDGATESIRQDDPCMAAWFLNNLAGSYFGLHRYREALKTYLEEKPLASRCGDDTQLGALLGNIASLYTTTGTGDLSPAASAADEALAHLHKPADAPLRASALMIRARIDARRGDMDRSVSAFREAVEVAARFGDPAEKESWSASIHTQATAWKELGEVLILGGRYNEAEEALANSYRLQVLNRIPPTAVTYRLLAELRRVQGDIPAAHRLIHRAIQQAAAQGPMMPMWRLYYERGRILLSENEPKGALEDFRTALNYIRRYRLEFLPADSFRISNENYLQDVYLAYVQTCNHLTDERNRKTCPLLTFETAEENRAVSLRTVLGTAGSSPAMSDEYLSRLNELESLERDLPRHHSAERAARAERLQAQLTEDELKAGIRASWLQPVPFGSVLAECRRRLRPNEALLSFSLGQPESYLWTVTNRTVRLYHLASQPALEALAGKFRGDVQSSAAGATRTGERLYRELFGQVDGEVSGKQRWILVLDRELFHLPYGALVAGRRNGSPVYLIERHAIQEVPAAAVLASRPTQPIQGPFVALGDPVYNRADRRWPAAGAPQSPSSHWLGTLFAKNGEEAQELPRLPGSGREIRTCADAWGGAGAAPRILLSGMDAGVPQLLEALRQPAAVLHIAAHFVPPRGPIQESRVALSLNRSGSLQLMSEREIYSRRVRIGTVVLSGCASGDGAALPATGLLGMTRAWLAAGAHSVAASLWPTPDDTGEIFVQFYRHLRALRSEGIADPEPVALQRAQLALLNSNSWRSQPAQWAAYFLVTKD